MASRNPGTAAGRAGTAAGRAGTAAGAVEPPGAALLIAVLEGLEVAADRYPEAVLASADVLRQVRAGQAPEAAAYAYDDSRSFLAEFP